MNKREKYYFYDRLEYLFYLSISDPNKIFKERKYLKIKDEYVNNFIIFIKNLSYIERVNYFIKQGATISSKNKFLIIPALIKTCNKDVLDFLFYKNISISWFDNFALKYFVKIGKTSIINYLVKNYNADLHYNDDILLWYACKYNNIDTVKYLLDNGLNIHSNNDAAIKIASFNGNYFLVSILLRNDADLHSENEFCLKCALINNDLNTLKLLFENGGNIDVDEGRLLCDAIEEKNMEIFNYLLQNSNNLNKFKKPLLTALSIGNIDIIKLMYKNGFDLHKIMPNDYQSISKRKAKLIKKFIKRS